MIYLDNAATTLQKPPAVRHAVARAMQTMASPGRGGHLYARRAAETAFRCRELASGLFHTDGPEQVVFTFNATHGLNIAIRDLLEPGGSVVISPFEHNAVLRPLYGLNAQITVLGREEPFGPYSPENVITKQTDLVVINHVSNVYGCTQDVERIADVCRTLKVPLVIDASQSAGCKHIDFLGLGASYIAMPGHKGLYGPQGTGILLCARPGAPLLRGGTGSDSASPDMPALLPDRQEAGTHNVPGIAGLYEGLSFVAHRTEDAIDRHAKALTRRLITRLRNAPGVRVCHEQAVDSGVVSVVLDGVDCERAGDLLAGQGIAVRAGLHCAPLAHKSGGTFETGTVRLSVSAFNTPEQIDTAARALRRLAKV